MESKNDAVTITYSAEEQKELNAIRAKYASRESKPFTNLDKAKAIDAKVESKGVMAGLVTGICGTLVTGLGMSCVLVWNKLVLGIVIGLAGLAVALAAYPLYQRVIQKERAKVADEILRLSEENEGENDPA